MKRHQLLLVFLSLCWFADSSIAQSTHPAAQTTLTIHLDQPGATAKPCICGNVGSATVQEMMEWIEYMTSESDSPLANLRRQNGREKPWKVKYFGISNESWGCGGTMRPEYYADEFRRYSTFVKNFGGN